MGRRRRNFLLEKVEITDAGSEGKAAGRSDNKVVFVPYAAPGDIVDVMVTKNRKNYYEGRIEKFHKKSDLRIDPKCKHFSICGGCKWQHLDYSTQLKYKQLQVVNHFERIGGFKDLQFEPIIGSEENYDYRNKLEFTFTNRKWVTDFSKDLDFADLNMNALGFHVPGSWDRVLDIEECHLQKQPSNDIRLFVKQFADDNELSFYHLKEQYGLLRNMIIRTTSTNQLMVIVIFGERDQEAMELLLEALEEKFEIDSLLYAVNKKQNDSIYDLNFERFSGKEYIIEKLKNVQYQIGPKTFFQTNSIQAEKLYDVTLEFAQLKSTDIVYDLYCGAGAIGNYLAAKVKKVVGIESVEEAVVHAGLNSKLNSIENTEFVAGDMMKMLDDQFVNRYGKPDVIITDPPRAGMHDKVVAALLHIEAEKIVYVSCNSATQARDIELLSEKYKIIKLQSVDMFPQTQHIENVALLEIKSEFVHMS